MKIGFVSLGCGKNQTDTETMLGLLNHHEIVNQPQDAEIIIVNTCGFIENAKQESIDNILEMAGYKRTGNCKLLIVAGCLAQRYQEEILKEMPEVDLVVGTSEYYKISEIIDEAIKFMLQGELKKAKDAFDENLVTVEWNEKQSFAVKINKDINTIIPENLPRVLTTPFHTAYLKIADGCDNNCTYCIIPKLRGNYRSRKIEYLLKEAEDLARQGVKELLIIAQDTAKYGTDIYEKNMLPGLLNELCKIKGIEWIRLHYCYPEGINEKLIYTIKNQSKICNYLDIPIQHCNDDILKRMGRRSTKDGLIRLFSTLKNELADIALRTSIIVGFPGETDEQFNELLDFMDFVKFDRGGVFKYSQEEDTAAALYKDQIDEKTKNLRQMELMKTLGQSSKLKNNEFVGKTIKVLIEGNTNSLFYGRSYRDSMEIDGKVFVKSKNELKKGCFYNVTVQKANEYDLTGILEGESP